MATTAFKITGNQDDRIAQKFLQRLQAGSKPDRSSIPECGEWTSPVSGMWYMVVEGRNTFDFAKANFRDFPIDELLSYEFPSENGHTPPAQEAQETTILDIPQLDPDVQPDPELARQASPVLDEMIEYFRYWATRSYEGYHEAVALWVLSTIAARRVYLPWQDGVWTNLYIVLVSDSTVNAKTKAGSYGNNILEACGLDFLLIDEITPQRLLSKMSGNTVPRNYSIMDDIKKKRLLRKLAFCAQKGWRYDEFGDFLQEMIKGKGTATQFYKLLKQLYDNRRRKEYDTITRGEEEIEMAYLSVLGTTPPASLKPIARNDSAVWTDGAFSRVAWIVSPDEKPNVSTAPDGEAVVPEFIVDALKDWHERLGEPTCEIIDNIEREELLNEALGKDNKKKRRDIPDYTIERGELPQVPITNFKNSGVHAAHSRYYANLANIAYENGYDGRFKSSYGRLPDMALKIAMLLASLENDNSKMEMCHWHRGVEITERWRASFHRLVYQMGNNDIAGGFGEIQELVIDALTTKLKGQMHNSYDIMRAGSPILRKAGSAEVRNACNELADMGKIQKQGQGRGALYGIELTK